ncbi:MAG: DNA cytosine methyltransferase [Oscillochloris sp.]|nr:DNA cytosine methyltransferase [Oscillochloris sp.]
MSEYQGGEGEVVMLRSIELFTGAGGLALGTHRAGFHHLAVIERDSDSCETLRFNSARHVRTGVDWVVIEQDVRHIHYATFADTSVDLLVGGAPCQPFSIGGKHAGFADHRNMFPEVFRAMREIRPRAVLLENVRGLIRENFKPYFDYLCDQLACPFIPPRETEAWWDHAARLRQELHVYRCNEQDTQYDVHVLPVNVADYGIPQERQRVFMVAFRRDLGVKWRFPAATHSVDALLYAQYVDGSYWREHNLSARHIPDRYVSRVARLARTGVPPLRRWRTVRDAIGDLPEPFDRVAHASISNHIGIPDARIYPGHTGSPWDWPSKTIKAGDHGNPGGENMLRYDDGSVRYFTVRELARLQTFPDEWQFAVSWSESRRQLGNAVPVMMAETLARAIAVELKRAPGHARLTPHEIGHDLSAVLPMVGLDE